MTIFLKGSPPPLDTSKPIYGRFCDNPKCDLHNVEAPMAQEVIRRIKLNPIAVFPLDLHPDPDTLNAMKTPSTIKTEEEFIYRQQWEVRSLETRIWLCESCAWVAGLLVE